MFFFDLLPEVEQFSILICSENQTFVKVLFFPPTEHPAANVVQKVYLHQIKVF